jgi:hypothetical protein
LIRFFLPTWFSINRWLLHSSEHLKGSYNLPSEKPLISSTLYFVPSWQ